METSCETGECLCPVHLGQMYRGGQGVPKDYKTAVRYTLAAEQGNADAQFNLGLMYDNGNGVPEDDKTAVKGTNLLLNRIRCPD